MTTTEILGKVQEILKKRVLIEKSPRVKRNLKIIELVLNKYSYQEIGETLEKKISRQAIGDIISNSKKVLEVF